MSACAALTRGGCADRRARRSSRRLRRQRRPAAADATPARARELAETMEVTHPDLFHDVSRASVPRRSAASSSDAAPGLTPGRARRRPDAAGCAARRARRPHRASTRSTTHARRLHVYPLRLYDFADGLYVDRRVGPTRTSAGRRVTAIDGTADRRGRRAACGRSCRTTTSRASAGGCRSTSSPRRCCGASGSPRRGHRDVRRSRTGRRPSSSRSTRRDVASDARRERRLRAARRTRDPVWLRELDDRPVADDARARRGRLPRLPADDGARPRTSLAAARRGSRAKPGVRRVDRRRPAQRRRRQHDVRRRCSTSSPRPAISAQARPPHRPRRPSRRRATSSPTSTRATKRAHRRRARGRRAEPVGRLDRDRRSSAPA